MSEIEVAFNKAEQLREEGKHKEALTEYTKVIHFAPRHWPSYFHLGVLFGEMDHNELALALLSRSDVLNPDNAVIQNHLSDILIKLSRNDEAIELLEKSWAIDSNPENISALAKIGRLLREMNRPKEAMEYFNQVLASDDSIKINEDLKHVTRWLRGLCKMALGDYLGAWDDYESRVNLPGVITAKPSGEKWLGQPLEGKIIFLAYEQRFGDILQFIRFIPKLNEMGAHVLLQTPPELERQLKYFDADVELVSTSAPLPDYDYHQLATSIPAVLGLSQDDIKNHQKAYLGIDEEAVKPVIPMRNGTRLKVGLVWSGKPEPDRSIPLEKYIPLLRHQDVSFYSFQIDEHKEDMQAQAVAWVIHDFSPLISDFYDSSVLLKEMDLFITIDTAAAHQAGALGIPVWLMLRYFSDWRWMLNCDDNIWYPTMRLFRQTSEDSWDEVGRELELAFGDWVAKSIDGSKDGLH